MVRIYLKQHWPSVNCIGYLTVNTLFALGISVFLVSCTATNNLYLNNPIPVGKSNVNGYLGLGTGAEAKIDSVSFLTGEVFSSGKPGIAPALSLAFQYGISDRTDFRFAIHFPKLIGGVGLRLGVQHSLFDSHSGINIALGADFGYAFSNDSIKIFGTRTEIDKSKNGILNADVFLPVSLKLNGDVTLVLTPRYSLNTFYIRKYQDVQKGIPFKVKYPALSLGCWLKYFYMEVTGSIYDHTVYPYFGVAWKIHMNDD